MKYLILSIASVISLTALGQTAQDAYAKGVEKSNAQDYSGSIKEYDKAIKLDSRFTDAYYNRGTSNMYLEKNKEAILDFDKAIELKPDFANAFINRGVAKLRLNDPKSALKDFDSAVKYGPSNSLAFLMRGQVNLQIGNTNDGCKDLAMAKKLGDDSAEKLINQYCNLQLSDKPKLKESLMLDWPDSEGWKVGDDQENSQQHVIDLIHSDETIDNWTELGNMSVIYGATGIPVDKAMDLMFEETKSNAPKAKLTFIEKNETAEYPWIIFTIESPGFKNDKVPESQLWYIIQGKTALYTNFRAIKKATIPQDLKDKWTNFFKTGKIVNR